MEISEQQLYFLNHEKAINSKVKFYVFHDPVVDYLESLSSADIKQFMLSAC